MGKNGKILAKTRYNGRVMAREVSFYQCLWVTKFCWSRTPRTASVHNSFRVLRCMWKEPAPLDLQERFSCATRAQGDERLNVQEQVGRRPKRGGAAFASVDIWALWGLELGAWPQTFSFWWGPDHVYIKTIGFGSSNTSISWNATFFVTLLPGIWKDCYPPRNYITGISMERNWVLYWLNATALSIILKQKHTTKYLSSCWMALFLKAMWDKEKSKSGLQIKISCIWTGWLCRSLNKRQHFLKE